MPARPPILLVPKNLYKHFAVVTVAVTLCIAIFADGAQQEEISESIASHQAAKAQESQQQHEVKRVPMVAGLHDNRGGANSHVIDNNPDVGTMPSGTGRPATFALDEMTEWSESEQLPTATQRSMETKRRKLPPVLPPGMAPLPGLPVSAEPATDASSTAA